MRFATLLAGAAVFSGATASPLFINLDIGQLLGIDLTVGNHYGAPIPPWGYGSHPGWYSGTHPGSHPGLTCLHGVRCHFLFAPDPS